MVSNMHIDDILVMDRAYTDFVQMTQLGIVYVIKMKRNLHSKRVMKDTIYQMLNGEMKKSVQRVVFTKNLMDDEKKHLQGMHRELCG